MFPNVDCFCSAHNIASLQELGLAISQTRDSDEKQRLMVTLAADEQMQDAANYGVQCDV